MTFELHHGDCMDVLRTMADNSVDAIVTDPPYGLSFMGKKWDYDVPATEVWVECLRVLKPGGHLLAFAGTRTQHRMAVRIEDAGFEIRDMIAWVYGCLDETTEVATEYGVKPYHKTRIGDRVLCYDVERGEYTYQPILEIVEYDYSDTAYRLLGDFGEQVVSRNHRVIVERGGSEAFQLAETLECEAHVPFLESLPTLHQALHDAEPDTSATEQDMLRPLRQCAHQCGEHRCLAPCGAQGGDSGVCSMRDECLETERLASQSRGTDLQQTMQRCASRCGAVHPCAPGACQLEAGVRERFEGSHDWRQKPCVEGRVDIPKPEGSVREPTDQVRAVPDTTAGNGPVRRLRDGAPNLGGGCDQPTADPGGVCSPHQPRCDGQPAREPDAVLHQCAAQGVRAWGGHRSAVVRVVPFHYTGKVWCLRVPTGAFVAVRNGVAFPTGNSGFPKSHNGEWGGTALKPALEPITVARKPLIGTVEANWREHGTGALNIDGCRVGDFVNTTPSGVDRRNAALAEAGYRPSSYQMGETVPSGALGRWPANLIHDGSAEVLAGFPDAKAGAAVKGTEPSGVTAGIYGKFDGRMPFQSHGDTGSAARFFYTAKASQEDRDAGLHGFVKAKTNDGHAIDADNAYQRGATLRANIHPTVKPTDLMRYLCRLVTPPGGVVLDPFNGSGSTGKAAVLEGFRYIGCERESEYIEISRARIEHALALRASGMDKLAPASARDAHTVDLFGEAA